MLSISVEDKNLIVKDIEKEQLFELNKWFNNDDNNQYKYAMGMSKPVTIEDLYEKYLEVLISTQEFFLGINYDSDFIGFLKGRVDYKNEGEIWIMSMLIDAMHQNKGLGKRVLNLAINEFSEKLGITKYFACLVNDNKHNRRFWENNGFEEFRLTKNYFTIDNKSYDLIIMRKQLKN